jgi:hypothetical protein
MNPLIPTPNILDRAAGHIVLQFKNDPSILGYRVRTSNSLVNAYGTANGLTGVGTVALLDVQRDQSFISKTIRQRRTGISGDTTRGQTRAIYDPNDFVGLAATVPPDNQLAFMRMQVRTTASPTFPVAADNTNQSVILVVQDPMFLSVPRPSLTLSAVAPTLGSAVAGLPAPTGALVFRVPGYAEAIVIINHEAAAGQPLLFASGLSQPLARIDAATSIMHGGGMKDEFVFCAAAGNPAFSVLITTFAAAR